MPEFDAVAIIVAVIAAATSALATILTLSMTRKNNKEIEEIRKGNNKEIEEIKKGNSEQLERLKHVLNLETERLSLQKRLANNYLLQLQDAVELLWERFSRIHDIRNLTPPYYGAHYMLWHVYWHIIESCYWMASMHR